MKYRLSTLILFLGILTSLSHSAYAETLKAAIFDIAPWGYRDSNGDIAGIENDIIQALSKEIQEPIEISLVPYRRMLTQLQGGHVDFSIFFRSAKSEQYGEPIVKWGELDIIVIGLKGTDIQQYNDLKSLKIGVRLGGFFNPKFDQDTHLDKKNVVDYASAVSMLKKQRLDAVVGTAATLFNEFQSQGISVEQLGQPFHLGTKEDWIHFSKKSKNPQKKQKLEAAVKKLIKDGTFEQVFSQYLPSQWRHKATAYTAN